MSDKKNSNFKVSFVETKPDPAKEFTVKASSEGEAKKMAEKLLKDRGVNLDDTEVKVEKVELGEDGSFKTKDELKAEEKAAKNQEDK